MEQAFFNARIITGEETIFGSVLVRDGCIAAVDSGGRVGEDCEGDLIAPGIIDMHTDNLEKHYFPRANIDWDPVSATIVHDGLCASVGVTTVYDSLAIGSFANVARAEDNQMCLIDGVGHAVASGLLRVDHRFHWRCELTAPDMIERLERVAGNRLTGLFSLMDHTPGQRQYRNLEKAMQSWRAEGMSDADTGRRITEMRAAQAAHVVPNRRAVSDIARSSAVPLAAHDDETVGHIDDAVEAGATIAEFPVTQEAARRARAMGMTVVMGGPNLIRGGSYSGNVSAAALAHDGLLDAFASDYVPRSLVECALRLTEDPHRWSLAKAWATVSATPARALGLDDRGELTPGKRADLVRIRHAHGHALVRGVWVEGRRAA